MPDLLKKPFGTRGKTHEITPASAGWRYVGFSLYHLKPGDKAAEVANDREVMLVMVEGKAHIKGAGQDWGVLGDRMDVFEKTPPHLRLKFQMQHSEPFGHRMLRWTYEASTSAARTVA
jgi:5-deoxy-glucuronate isomerase